MMVNIKNNETNEVELTDKTRPVTKKEPIPRVQKFIEKMSKGSSFEMADGTQKYFSGKVNAANLTKLTDCCNAPPDLEGTLTNKEAVSILVEVLKRTTGTNMVSFEDLILLNPV